MERKMSKNCWKCNQVVDEGKGYPIAVHISTYESVILCEVCKQKLKDFLDEQFGYWFEDNKYHEPIDYDHIPLSK